MNEVFSAALQLHEFCEHQGWRFCFIGGVAVHRWGEQRTTDDVDITLLTGFGNEEAYIDELLRHFTGREPAQEERAIQRRVLFLVNSDSVNLDVALGGIPFEFRSIQRSSLWELRPKQALRTCSAEDLLVHKCFANRDRDWTDVEGVLIRQWQTIDLEQVRRELKPLAELKEALEILERLNRLVGKLNQSAVLSQLRRR
ncbi:MAG: nucleotidyl transferase AbiEii/AbiGii toxin family protein [Verrucomicrobiales bacterium]|nr:nucleotidyl transferase AbiEii/AbiGii toxin family protein [Verrucomicrobiales bacterium]